MATSNLSLKPPENFDFAKRDQWSKWKKLLDGRMESMSSKPLDVKTQFPKVFSGLGTLGDEYII